MSSDAFNASSVDLDAVDSVDVICYLNASTNSYDGRMGARVSALFVILFASTAVTLFPVLAKRVRWLRVPLYMYLFARYFGAGVIISTAFIHLLDPAYAAIGPQTCVGMTGQWADYAWCPAIVLVSIIVIFLVDFAAERYVEIKYGAQDRSDIQAVVTGRPEKESSHDEPHHHPPQADEEEGARTVYKSKPRDMDYRDPDREWSREDEISFQQQFAAFLTLEFGVIFHSVIIGLNLGVAGAEFTTLYPVVVFHQSFEGLGIGARLSAIPFRKGSWIPWILCLAYGLTTPIAIAVGLGLRDTYNSGSFTANVISGVLNAISAGILIYTGLVEMLARDFLFNPTRTKDDRRILFMIACMLLGVGLMSLLGKWA